MADTLNLSGFHVKLRDLIGVALDLGWTAQPNSGRSIPGKTLILLHSHDGTQTVRVAPVRQVNDAKLNTLRRKIVKYADPVKRLTMLAKIEWAQDQGGDALDAFIDSAPSAVQAVVYDQVDLTEREVKELRPWLARKAHSSKGGTVYESTAVMERTWSDGDVDFVCSFPECGWSNHRARSVANHYGSAHTAKGETTPGKKQEPRYPGHDYFEPMSHREYQPSERLIEALTTYLDEHMGETGDSRALARLALTWAHERPDLPDVEPTGRAALGPEEILERIRTLVGAPLASRLAEAEAMIAALHTQAAELEAVVMAREAAIDHLREERRTLAALMSEESE